MSRICISYRRADSTAIAGRIYDRLVSRYGAESVFMDVSDIPLGVDFRDQIQTAFRDTKVLVAIIGPEWLGERNKLDVRIQEKDDPIRVEIHSALSQQISVIPVLIDDVKMPPAESLPPDIREFAYRNALRLDTGIDFQTHIERLMTHIDSLMPTVRPMRPATAGGQTTKLSLVTNWCARLLPYALVAIVLLLLAHYLIIMIVDTYPIYLRLVATIISLGCGFVLFRKTQLGAGGAAIVGLFVAIVAVPGMWMFVGLFGGGSILPSKPIEWQEAFEYLATITLATAAGSVLARLVYSAVQRRSGTL